MKEILFTLLGSIISIIVTWIFNLISNKRQHKMDMQRLAVQNKLEVSKTAISWLMETKNELYCCIWSLEHYKELEPAIINNVIVRAQNLTILGAEAKNNFNAIELYYDLDDIANLLPSVIRSWTKDEIPDEIYSNQENIKNMFTEEIQTNEIIEAYEKNIIGKRLKDFEETKVEIENKLNEENID
jgi:hypothetical protein